MIIWRFGTVSGMEEYDYSRRSSVTIADGLLMEGSSDDLSSDDLVGVVDMRATLLR